MAFAPPLSSRDVRRTSKEALEAVQSLGNVVNGNATLLNEFSKRLTEVERRSQVQDKELDLYNINCANLTARCEFFLIHGTFWQRLRWLIRGT